MADQLSGIAIIICIAFGVLTFILLFIFAKRQIVRFTLKSRGELHAPVGEDATRELMLEIERRLKRAASIQCEPCLLTAENDELFSDDSACENLIPTHLYRMKVVHEIKNLDILVASTFHTKKRTSGEDVNVYYTRLHQKGMLTSLEDTTLKDFLNLYERARYLPEDFSYPDYKKFTELLSDIQSCIANSGVVSDEEIGLQKNNVPKDCNEAASLLRKSISFDSSSSKCKKQQSSVETQV